MDSLRRHRQYLENEWSAAQAAPLSTRKAMLVAALVDAYVDRLFAATPGADDVLDFRAEMARQSEALGQVMALCSGRARPVTEAVAIELADYGALSVEDFMVSLYNDHSVQRVLVALPDGSRRDIMDILRQAIMALDRPF